MFSLYRNFLHTGYTKIVRPVFFKIDPEKIHDRATTLGRIYGVFGVSRWFTKLLFDYKHPNLKQTIEGIDFPNPVGLSAGFDKNAQLVNILESVGFGFTQVGSVTYESYEGNPQPRLYRLPKSKGLVVYYGLKNDGVNRILTRLKRRKSTFPLSISVAKTNCDRTASKEAGIKDYVDCLKVLEKNSEVLDFYTINISCPNTFGGEPFTDPESLDMLLKEIDKLKIKKPTFIKMPLSMPWKEFKALLDIALKYNVQGVVIANLNKNHKDPLIKDEIPEHVKGGISGLPTQKKSTELIHKTYKHCGDRLTIIGVGGIFNTQDAYEKIKAGASLVQLITGMIYEGPQMIGSINKELVQLMKQDGYSNISEAIGVEA